MAKTTARDRRAAGRHQRRAAPVDEPSVESAAKAVENDPAEALRAAASAAIAAAAVGAAKALARRGHEGGFEDDGDFDEEADEEPQDEVPTDEQESAGEDELGEQDESPRESVSSGDARRIVDRAREQLRDLHGAEAESVSAVRRIADGWRVGLEVVEVHRVPESTDVLATYEVEVDDDGDLITFERTTRYYRSEADRR